MLNDIDEIINRLLAEDEDSDFLFCVLQLKGFYGSNAIWKKITNTLLAEYKKNTNKLAIDYLHRLSLNSLDFSSASKEIKRASIEIISEYKNFLLDESKESKWFRIEAVETSPFHKLLIEEELGQDIFYLSTLEATILDYFLVTREELLANVYDGKLDIGYQQQHIVFNYNQIQSLFSSQPEVAEEIIFPDEPAEAEITFPIGGVAGLLMEESIADDSEPEATWDIDDLDEPTSAIVPTVDFASSDFDDDSESKSEEEDTLLDPSGIRFSRRSYKEEREEVEETEEAEEHVPEPTTEVGAGGAIPTDEPSPPPPPGIGSSRRSRRQEEITLGKDGGDVPTDALKKPERQKKEPLYIEDGLAVEEMLDRSKDGDLRGGLRGKKQIAEKEISGETEEEYKRDEPETKEKFFKSLPTDKKGFVDEGVATRTGVSLPPKVTRELRSRPGSGKVAAYDRQDVKRAPSRKRKAPFLPFIKTILFLPVKAILSVATITISILGLPFVLLSMTYRKIKKILQKKYTKKIGNVQVPTFEAMLSEEAGIPGPLERTIAQSKIILKALQITIGLRIVVFINLIDNLTSLVAGYITNIYRAWKVSKSIKKRLARKDPKMQAQGVQEELDIIRYQICRLLSFATFCPYQQSNDELKETFALELVLEIRYRIDEMKRDLSILTVKQMQETAQKTTWDFLKGFIPNPLEAFSPIKDFVILAFFMKYKRQDMEIIYINILSSYQDILGSLDEDTNFQFDYHEHEYSIQQKNKDSIQHEQELETSIKACRLKLQRLVQSLTNAQKFIFPKYWSTEDVLYELQQKDKENLFHAKFYLEWENRVNKKFDVIFQDNSTIRQYEKLYFKRRYQLEQKLSNMFI